MSVETAKAQRAPNYTKHRPAWYGLYIENGIWQLVVDGDGCPIVYTSAQHAVDAAAIIIITGEIYMQKLKGKKLVEQRINRAIIGYQIPMMLIPKLYRSLENAIVEGKSDVDLVAIVAEFPGVTWERSTL